MPRSKKEGLMFSFIMSAIMIYVMAALNYCVREHTMNSAAWIYATSTFILGYIIGIICDLFICSPLSRKITFSTTGENDQESTKIFIMRFCMVVLMTICMTFFGVIAGGATGLQILIGACVYFPYNFTIAMPLQMLIVAPLAFKIVKLICREDVINQKISVPNEESIQE